MYLDNGINESNSIVRIKHHIKSDSHISSEELHLQPLKIEHVAAILSNMTNLDPEHVKLKDLSRFIYHKTYGVPLLLHEILSHLKEKNMFKLIKKPASMSRTNSNDKISGTGESGVQQQQQEQKTDEEIGENVFWDWDLNMIMSEVSRFNISARAHLRAENIMTATTVDGTRLLLRNVRGLSKTCRRFLQLGSVLGRTFSLGPLVLGQKYHPSDIISDLNILLAKGYLSPVTFWASRLGDHIDQKYLLQLIKSDKLLFKFECDEFYRCVYQVKKMAITTRRLRITTSLPFQR